MPLPEMVTGIRPKVRASAPRRSMYDHWREIVTEAVEANGGVVRIAPSLFQRHLTTLLESYDHKTIRSGFRRFAELVRTGKVDVRDKTAWFVFMNRREQFVPQFKHIDSIADIEVKPRKTLADFKPRQGRNLLAPPD